MKDRKEKHIKENQYLDKYVFYGLKNLNDGFDVSSIKYFSASDFEIVLTRVKALGLGIYGIEPWKDGEFYDVVIPVQTDQEPTDPNWYMTAFEHFKKQKQNLQYAASYYIPDHLLQIER